MSTKTYHLSELSIAASPDDPRRVMPPISPDCQRILDIGCGAGQTLIACNLDPEALACGIDLDFDALRLGKELTQNIAFVCAVGERLPFVSNHFDMVISRVSLPYMHIPTALGEIGRALKPGGRLWLVLHSFSMARRHFLRSLRSGDLKDALFRCYVLVNGLLFHLLGTHFRFPLNRRPCESFQTDRGIKRALHAAGFMKVEIRRQKFFIVTARKAS